jgi:glycosyltransferase involved in cell wall biosynthesis
VCADRGVPILGHKGASVHVREITSALQAIGHEVTVLCARLGSGNPPPRVRHLVELPSQVFSDPDRVAELLAEAGAEAVVERYALETGAARVASTRLGLVHVLEVNAPIVLEAARYRGLGDVEYWLERERQTFATADAVVVVQRRLKSYVHGVAPDVSVKCVPNGVSVERFAHAEPDDLGVPPASTVIGFVGSMKPWHGVDDLVTAFAGLAPRHPSVQLVLAGDGPQTDAVVRRISAAGLTDRARLLGAIPHHRIPAVLRSFDIAVAPYRSTPDFYFGPLKVVEYLAAGLPIVYPAIGDMPEIIGASGVAYPPGDIAALGSALDSLVVNADRRLQLGAAARRRSMRHSWTHAADAITGVIEAAAAAGSISAAVATGSRT